MKRSIDDSPNLLGYYEHPWSFIKFALELAVRCDRFLNYYSFHLAEYGGKGGLGGPGSSLDCLKGVRLFDFSQVFMHSGYKH